MPTTDSTGSPTATRNSSFRGNSFSNPTALVKWVAAQGPLARVRPDMRIVVAADFEKLADRLRGTLRIMREIAKIAGKKG